MPPPPSSTKALNAILPLIAAGQAYEAHQKARTFASRYVKANQYDVAIDVLHQAAREMFKGGHLGSGTDLGVFMCDVYETKGEIVDEESRARITQLISLAGPGGQWRKTLIDKALIWSSKLGPYHNGDPPIHAFIGELLYKEHDFAAAEPYLLSSGSRDSARLLASMLFEWSRSGAEPGAYASRGTIPLLQVGNVLGARSFLSHFLSLLVSSHPDILAEPTPITMTLTPAGFDEIIPTNNYVLNFLQLAIRVCQRGAIGLSQSKQVQEIWVRLCASYQSRHEVLARPYYREALGEIGQLFFGLPPPRSANANPMADIMAAMMGGAPSAPRRSGLPPPAPSLTLD